MKKSEKRKNYGMELVLDLFDCDPKIISSRKKLQIYVDKLCTLIKMKKYGKTLLPYFGLSSDFTKGYSLLQFIETSSITGHFSELWNTAYINIFSCQSFNSKQAREFTKKFFKAKTLKNRVLIRK
ncbi:MAG: S-adenosylmethionine decarboxylase [Candidatus Omnitrophota bacterium]